MQALSGRTNRITYWLCIGAVVALVAALRLFGLKATVPEFVLVIAAIPRLHDIGRSGWWVLCPLAAEAALLPMVFLTELSGPALMGAAAIVTMVMAGAAIWLGVIPGEATENRFGRRPAPGFSFTQPRKTT